jgi:hypothetical protein
MAAGGFVNAFGIGPHSKIADMEHPVELHAEILLESEHVGVEPIERSVYVSGRADQHDAHVN